MVDIDHPDEQEAEESQQKAICIICTECEHRNWRKGASYTLMAEYAESQFTCEGCGRTLETGT